MRTISLILLMAFVLNARSDEPASDQAFRDYVQNHTTSKIMDVLTWIGNAGAENYNDLGAIQPICYSHIATFPVSIVSGKGWVKTVAAAVVPDRIVYEGFAVQLRVTYVISTHIAELPASWQAALLANSGVRQGRYWKVNNEERDYGENSFFFQKVVMVYYKRAIKSVEFWDADFMTDGAVE